MKVRGTACERVVNVPQLAVKKREGHRAKALLLSKTNFGQIYWKALLISLPTFLPKLPTGPKNVDSFDGGCP